MPVKFVHSVTAPVGATVVEIGYQLYTSGGATSGSRITSGIHQPHSDGVYYAEVTEPDDFSGVLVWDTGGSAPIHAVEEINRAPNAPGTYFTQVFAVSVPIGAAITQIGYQLFDTTGVAVGSHITTSIQEPATDEVFFANVSVPYGFRGILLWDTGGSDPLYTSEEINDGRVAVDIGEGVVRLLQFVGNGGAGTVYQFPAGWKVKGDANQRIVPSTKLARADGSRDQVGTLGQKEISMEGGFYSGPLNRNNIRDAIDAMRSALMDGPGDLYIYSDRRYRLMQAVDYPDSYSDTAFARFADSRVVFRGPDPFQYALSATSETWTSPGSVGSHTTTVEGGAYVQPVLTVHCGSTGTLTLQITNHTNGDVITLSGAVVSGNVVTIDTLNQTVKIGSTDRTDLFGVSRWMRLDVGANSLTAVVSAGTASSIGIDYLQRWP